MYTNGFIYKIKMGQNNKIDLIFTITTEWYT